MPSNDCSRGSSSTPGPGCHLCDDAQLTLDKIGEPWREIMSRVTSSWSANTASGFR